MVIKVYASANDNIPQLRLSYVEESKYIEISDFTNLVPFIKNENGWDVN